jgi:hypothetical protein
VLCRLPINTEIERNESFSTIERQKNAYEKQMKSEFQLMTKYNVPFGYGKQQVICRITIIPLHTCHAYFGIQKKKC